MKKKKNQMKPEHRKTELHLNERAHISTECIWNVDYGRSLFHRLWFVFFFISCVQLKIWDEEKKSLSHDIQKNLSRF